MASDLIECPFCAELIKVKAKKCRHCGEFLEQGLTQEEVLTEFQERKEALAEEAAAPVESAAAEEQAAVAAGAPPAAPPVPVERASVEAQAPAKSTPVEESVPAPVVVATEEGKDAAEADPLNDLYQKLADMPDSPERALVIQTLQQLAAETQKGKEAEEGKVEDMVKTVVQVLPDVAEVTINTMINPASGLLTLVQKVAQRVSKGHSKKEEPEPAQPEADAAEARETQTDEPVAVDAEKAAEALQEVRDQLSEMAESPEKELVEEAIQRLDKAGDEAEGETQTLKSKVAEVIGDVAESLPDVVEAAAEVLPDVAEAATDVVAVVATSGETSEAGDDE